jgi:hypothetical protein
MLLWPQKSSTPSLYDREVICERFLNWDANFHFHLRFLYFVVYFHISFGSRKHVITIKLGYYELSVLWTKYFYDGVGHFIMIFPSCNKKVLVIKNKFCLSRAIRYNRVSLLESSLFGRTWFGYLITRVDLKSEFYFQTIFNCFLPRGGLGLVSHDSVTYLQKNSNF